MRLGDGLLKFLDSVPTGCRRGLARADVTLRHSVQKTGRVRRVAILTKTAPIPTFETGGFGALKGYDEEDRFDRSSGRSVRLCWHGCTGRGALCGHRVFPLDRSVRVGVEL